MPPFVYRPQDSESTNVSDSKAQRRIKKLEKKLQRVQLKDLQNMNDIQHLDRLLREKEEKYRDMKQLFEFKVHERDT